MPRQRPPVLSVEEKFIDALVADDKAENFDTLQLLVSPEVESLIQPHLKHLQLGHEFSQRRVKKILETVVAKKCRFQEFTFCGKCSRKQLEATFDTLEEAKTIHICANFLSGKMDDLVAGLRKCDNLENLFLNVRAVKAETLEFILTRFKKLKNFGLISTNHEVAAFIIREKADRLKVETMMLTSPSWNLFSTFIENHGSKVAKLILDGIEGINMGRLLRQVPQLTSLYLLQCSSFERDPLDDQEIPPLKNLTKLGLFEADLSKNQWLALLSESTKLEEWVIDRCFMGGPVQERVYNGGFELREALEKVYESHRFPNLKNFDVNRIDGVRMADLLPMIENPGNPLQSVRLALCKEIPVRELEEYKRRVQRVGVDVKIEIGKAVTKCFKIPNGEPMIVFDTMWVPPGEVAEVDTAEIEKQDVSNLNQCPVN